ncbi:hypothetical protein Nmel_007239, partial [Mimus melanotis]
WVAVPGSPGITGIIRDHLRCAAPQRPARARAVPQGGAGPCRRLLSRTSPERAPGRRLPGKASLRPPRPAAGSGARRWQRGGRRRVAPARSGWGPRGHKAEGASSVSRCLPQDEDHPEQPNRGHPRASGSFAEGPDGHCEGAPRNVAEGF